MCVVIRVKLIYFPKLFQFFMVESRISKKSQKKEYGAQMITTSGKEAIGLRY